MKTAKYQAKDGKKVCSKCRVEKPLINDEGKQTFGNRAGSADGFNFWCKACLRNDGQTRKSEIHKGIRRGRRRADDPVSERQSFDGGIVKLPNGCAKFRGFSTSVNGEKVSPSRAAWYYAKGQLPTKKLVRNCSTPTCVIAAHFVEGDKPLSRKTPEAKRKAALALTKQGQTRTQVAKKLKISAGTVKKIVKELAEPELDTSWFDEELGIEKPKRAYNRQNQPAPNKLQF